VGIARHLFEREFVADSLKQRLIQATGQPEEAIRDPPLTAEQSGHGRQHRIEACCRLSGDDGRHRRPDQDLTPLIRGEALALNEFVLHIVQGRVIELQLPLEGPIRQTAPLA
jgi:hypothetical protein